MTSFVFFALIAFLALPFLQAAWWNFNFDFLFGKKKTEPIVTPDCNHHGHPEKGECVCRSQFTGKYCTDNNPKFHYTYPSRFNESSFYDWREMRVRRRINKLYNLDPEKPAMTQNDSFFPENHSSINISRLPDQWISLKKRETHLFSGDPVITEILQGGLQSCFFYAALASILNLPHGINFIRNAIPYYNEKTSIYVTKWFLFGQFIHVAVNDKVPGDYLPFFAQIPKSGAFWVAILEKAWAKIWGSYEAILFTSEVVIWNALTGAVFKRNINVYRLAVIPFLFRPLDFLQINSLITAKTPASNHTFIPDHSFSILGIYEVWQPLHLLPTHLIHLYNPWGVDLANNKWNDSSILLNSVKNQLPMEITNEDDGKFFISFEDFVLNFERIQVVETIKGYVPISVAIPLGPEIESDVEVVISTRGENLVDSLENIFIYFDLLNDDLFKMQVQPYQLSDIDWFPPKLHTRTDIPGKNFFFDNFKDGVSLIYQGLFGLFNPIPIITTHTAIKFRVKRFNYDITDKLYLAIYARKGSTQIIKTPTHQSRNCPQGADCKCPPNLFGKRCTLTQSQLYPSPDCSHCNPNNSFCLSTGVCNCFPGFDRNNNCLPCVDQSPWFCKFPVLSCLSKEIAEKHCQKTCFKNNCYIPGGQVRCEVDGCNYRGRCNLNTGRCDNCVNGYSGTYCQIAPANSNSSRPVMNFTRGLN